MIRRGTPASALASLAATDGTGVQETPLAAPAFADTPGTTAQVSATDGFAVEDPASTSTPTDRLDPF